LFRTHHGGHCVVPVIIAAFTDAVKPSQALPIREQTVRVDKILGCNREEPIVVAGGRVKP
jgi:hypothetical protein